MAMGPALASIPCTVSHSHGLQSTCSLGLHSRVNGQTPRPLHPAKITAALWHFPEASVASHTHYILCCIPIRLLVCVFPVSFVSLGTYGIFCGASWDVRLSCEMFLTSTRVPAGCGVGCVRLTWYCVFRADFCLFLQRKNAGLCITLES